MSPSTTLSPDVEAVEWADALDLPRDVGKSTIRAYADSPFNLHVFTGGTSVGRVFSRAYSDVAITVMGDVSTPEGLRKLARDYVNRLRGLKLAEHPDRAFETIGPADFDFANATGTKLGWTLYQGDKVVERFVIYVAAIPNGLQWFQAAYDPTDDEQGGFPRDAPLAEFLAALDEVMATARLPLRDAD